MAKFSFFLKQGLKLFMQDIILPVVYRVGCIRKPDPDLIVFADAHHEQRPVSMDALIKYIYTLKDFGISKKKMRININIIIICLKVMKIELNMLNFIQ